MPLTPQERSIVKRAIDVLDAGPSPSDRAYIVGLLSTLIIEDVEDVTPSASTFPIWRTVTIGNHASNKQSFKEMIEAAGMNVSSWAEEILKDVEIIKEPQTLNLVKVTVEELGLTGLSTTKQIYDAAQAQGLSLCPAEVGPQLRLQYADQPKGEYALIAMEPIEDSHGGLGVFNVGHDEDGRWLFTDRGHPDSRWLADFRWVFVRR